MVKNIGLNTFILDPHDRIGETIDLQRDHRAWGPVGAPLMSCLGEFGDGYASNVLDRHEKLPMLVKRRPLMRQAKSSWLI